MADIGERLGGDNIEFTVDKPLRIIIGGPPHSGKSTFMNLLEDRFRYYQIPVELLDLDLSAPTPLKTGFTQQRDKKKWTSTLAEEAREMFEGAEGVQVVLGDSVGLISEINEIISQPADVAILLVSGGHGDYDTTYRKVVRKWKEYYQDIRTPLLVVLRSTMNPADESMFDPQDNYGVVVGLDRDAYEANVISGHYRYDGLYPTNACLEGVVFEIAQSFDLKVRSATDPEHLDLLNQKWPDLKDKKTWTPPADSMLGGIERAYFEERGRVPADQRAESFGADGHYLRKSKYDDNGRWDIYWEGDSRYRNYAITLKDNPNDIRIVVEYGDRGYSLAIPQPDIIKNFSTMNEVLEYLDNMGDVGRIGQPSIGVFAHRFSTNRSYPTVGDWGAESFSADGWDSYTVSYREEEDDPHFEVDDDYDDLNEAMSAYQHFINTGMNSVMIAGYTLNEKGDYEEDSKPVAEYSKGAYDNRPQGYSAESFGADSTPRFIPVEVIKYADWWTRRYGREYNPRGVNNYDYSYVVCVRDIPIAHFDTKEKAENHARTARTTINVLGGMSDSRIDHPLALKEMDGYADKNIRGGMNMAESFGAEDDLSFKEWADQETMTHGQQEPFDDWLNDELSSHGDNITLQDWGQHELDSHYERYGAEGDPKVRRLKTIAKWINDNHGDTHFADMRDTQYGYYNAFNQHITKDGEKLVVYELTPKGKYPRREVFSHNPLEPYRNNKEVESWVKNTFTTPVTLRFDTPFFYAAEGMTSFEVINIEYSNSEGTASPSDYYDLPDELAVSVEETDVSATEDRIREKIESYIFRSFGEDIKVVDLTAFYTGTTDPLRGNYEDYEAEEKIHSQLMIGSLIGLGAGLWAVNRFKESREER